MNNRAKKTAATKNPWIALAQELRAARVELGYGRRSDFVRHLLEEGMAKPSVDRILGDIERGSRANYSINTLSAVEVWYGLHPGDIHRILGGEKRAFTIPVARKITPADPEVRLAAAGWDLVAIHGMKLDELMLVMKVVVDTLASRAS